MDAVRSVTGTNDLLSLAASTDSLNNFNGLKTVLLPNDTNLNQLATPGVYNLWNKPVKNSPVPGSDQGSILLVLWPNKDSDWMAQLFLTFYNRADSAYQISNGKTSWTKLSWNKMGRGSNSVHPDGMLSTIKRLLAPQIGGAKYVA